MLLCCAEWRLGRQDECGGRGVQEGEGVDGAAGGDGGVLKGMDAFNTKNDFLQLPKNAFHSGVKISKASLMRIYSRVYISKNTITHLVRLRIDIRSEHNHQRLNSNMTVRKDVHFSFLTVPKDSGKRKQLTRHPIRERETLHPRRGIRVICCSLRDPTTKESLTD